MTDSTLDSEGLWKDDPGMMSTYTRRRVNPLTMTADDVDIRDIARALTMQCRYNGHVGTFYSVAEHCMRVADELPQHLQLAGLLHDAAEAYLGDLIRPLKHTDFGKGYLEAEAHVEQQIAAAFGLAWPHPPEVMAADTNVLMAYELAGVERRWSEDRDPSPRLMSIEQEFLDRFRKLAVPLIVGIGGYAQSGKDTLAGILVEEHGFTRLAFADVLRDVLYALNPTVRSDSASYRLEEVVRAYGWEWAKANTDARELLQRMGTEAGREILGQNVWVDATMDKIREGRRYVISDMRFPNELEAVKLHGGTTVRMIREGQNPANAHVSETALDTAVFDRVIHSPESPDGHVAALRTVAADLVAQISTSKVGA